jgi:hypothetical protein
MALREYVRADDIDLAISVAVESFVNAQKMSIKKTLQRVRSLFLVFLIPQTSRLRDSGNTSRNRKTMKSSCPSCSVASSRKRRGSISFSIISRQSSSPSKCQSWMNGCGFFNHMRFVRKT